MRMSLHKLYLITTNDKSFDEWAKKKKKELVGVSLDTFNQGYNEMHNGAYLPKASFVCYWEIASSAEVAKLAPAITQASLIHMLHRFIERENYEEVEVTTAMIGNFMRLLGRLGETDEEE
jgi:hypothetical protein